MNGAAVLWLTEKQRSRLSNVIHLRPDMDLSG